MSDERLIERLALLDAHPNDVPLPAGWLGDTLDPDVEGSTIVSTIQQLKSVEPPSGGPNRRWLAAAAVAAVIAIAAIVLLRPGGNDVIVDPTAPTTTTTSPVPAAVDPTLQPTRSGAADAGCGLSERATGTSTVDPTGESVTFEIMSDPACGGVAVQLVATPAMQGIPIVKNLTLDDTGATSITEQLAGQRQAIQEWSVEVIASEAGAVAATGAFTVGGFCDLAGSADLHATYLPDTREVDIVLTVDPLCAGRTLTFENGARPLYASAPSGGWALYTVDENGEVAVTEQLLDWVSGPNLNVEAIEAGPGATGGPIASVLVDIGG